ncbi:MAG: hypothetical protein HOP28_15340 [Gemmatimonadales bacterium]|nr:hypothetical protein [Gemmatimonadales bacterium]
MMDRKKRVVQRALAIVWIAVVALYVVGGGLLWYGPIVVPSFGALLVVPIYCLTFVFGGLRDKWLTGAVVVQVLLALLWWHFPSRALQGVPEMIVGVLFLANVALPIALGVVIIRRLRTMA